MTFSIDIHQDTLVKKLKPAVVKVYDYYEPGKNENMYFSRQSKFRVATNVKRNYLLNYTVLNYHFPFIAAILTNHKTCKYRSEGSRYVLREAGLFWQREQNCERIYNGQ